MRRISIIAALATAAPLGCTAPLELSLERLERRVGELSRQVSQSQVRGEALANRLVVLEEELARRRVAEGAGAMTAAKRDGAKVEATAKPAEPAPPAPPSSAERTSKNRIVEAKSERSDGAAAPKVAPAAEGKAPRRERVTDEPGDLPVVRLAPGESARAKVAAADASAVEAPKKADAAPLEIPKLAPRKLYARGLGAFRRGELGVAIAHFAAFVERFPAHSLADNSLYWTGRARAKKGDPDGAIAAYEDCIRRYPTGNKVPDAVLALAEVLSAKGRTTEAREKLAHVAKTFPASSAGRIASRRLAEMKP